MNPWDLKGAACPQELSIKIVYFPTHLPSIIISIQDSHVFIVTGTDRFDKLFIILICGSKSVSISINI